MGLRISRTKYDEIVNRLIRSRVCGIYKIAVQEPTQEDLRQKVSRLIDDPLGHKWVVHVDIEGGECSGYWKIEDVVLDLALNRAREVLLRHEERLRIRRRLEAKMEKLETYKMTIEGTRSYKAKWFHENYEKELKEKGI